MALVPYDRVPATTPHPDLDRFEALYRIAEARKDDLAEAVLRGGGRASDEAIPPRRRADRKDCRTRDTSDQGSPSGAFLYERTNQWSYTAEGSFSDGLVRWEGFRAFRTDQPNRRRKGSLVERR